MLYYKQITVIQGNQIMPGAYAHITLVNMLSAVEKLEGIPDMPTEAIESTLAYFKYCELGAVSPDYPYLALGDSDAAKWADLMHYTKTGKMIQTGIEILQTYTGDKQKKCLAWLLGYTAHVVADVTIHPVVELKVGPYHENQKDHRTCEMNQDAYIFNRMNLGNIGLCEHLDSGIADCCERTSGGCDDDIKILWLQMLESTHPTESVSNPPDIDKWHKGFTSVVDVVEEGNKLFPLARHVGADNGLTYPLLEEVNHTYIDALRTPRGLMKYDDIFDFAIQNTAEIWGIVAKGVFNNDKDYITEIGNWNLDTGRNTQDEYVFWS